MMLTVPLLFAFSGKERKAIPVVVFNALLFGFLISAAERISETTEIERAELFSEGSAVRFARTAAYSGRRSVA